MLARQKSGLQKRDDRGSFQRTKPCLKTRPIEAAWKKPNAQVKGRAQGVGKNDAKYRRPLEPPVRLVRVGEGVGNTKACISLPMLGLCIDALPLTEWFSAFCTNSIGANPAMLPGLPQDRARTNVASHIRGIAQ